MGTATRRNPPASRAAQLRRECGCCRSNRKMAYSDRSLERLAPSRIAGGAAVMAASSCFEAIAAAQRDSAAPAGVTLPPGPEHIADDQRRRPDHPDDEHKDISAPL